MADACKVPQTAGRIGGKRKAQIPHLAAHFEDSNGADMQRVGTLWISNTYIPNIPWSRCKRDEGHALCEFVPFVYNI